MTMRIIKGFTLIEILVSLVVFGIVMATVGGIFCRLFNDWQRQKTYFQSFENVRWALDIMSRDIRASEADTMNDSAESGFNAHELLLLYVDKGQGHSQADNRAYYWKNNSANDFDTLYRAEVPKNRNLAWAISNNKQEVLAKFIVNATFNVTDQGTNNSTVSIVLVTRPKPAEAEVPANRNYMFRTQVRPRN
jgi:prepilin-type N-terminal cleavage/methylation domain-containing protein